MVAVEGFTPSVEAFQFPNAWPQVAAFTIRVLGVDVEVGNAARGLCGGMVFAVRDYFEAGVAVPQDMVAPRSGPLYEYVGRRLKESFDLPLGPSKYLQFMASPDGDKGIPLLSWLIKPRVRGIAWYTIHDEVPKILVDIDSGKLSCIGLVCAQGVDPKDLGMNHQVLAYKYERAVGSVKIWVYDPNRPHGDDAYLEFATDRPTKATPIRFINGSKQVRGFFRVAYRHSTPPSDPLGSSSAGPREPRPKRVERGD